MKKLGFGTMRLPLIDPDEKRYSAEIMVNSLYGLKTGGYSK